MPVTVWPVDPKSRRTLPTHEHSAAARVQENQSGELLVLGAATGDVLDTEPEAPPLAVYSRGAWFRAIVTDAEGEIVEEIGITA